MEEKERYKFDKERYIIFQDDIFDLSNVCDLLNKQSKRIKELQEKLHILNEQSQNNYYRERYTEALKENNQLDKRIEELEEENKQLKQQLHDLPKKIVTDFYDEIRHRAMLEDDYCPDHNLERKYGVRKCLLENIKDTILKKYGGENDL